MQYLVWIETDYILPIVVKQELAFCTCISNRQGTECSFRNRTEPLGDDSIDETECAVRGKGVFEIVRVGSDWCPDHLNNLYLYYVLSVLINCHHHRNHCYHKSSPVNSVFGPTLWVPNWPCSPHLIRIMWRSPSCAGLPSGFLLSLPPLPSFWTSTRISSAQNLRRKWFSSKPIFNGSRSFKSRISLQNSSAPRRSRQRRPVISLLVSEEVRDRAFMNGWDCL